MQEKMFRRYKKRLRVAANDVNKGLLRYAKNHAKLAKRLLAVKLGSIDTVKYKDVVKRFEVLAKVLLKE